ncbi:MAG: inositol monophosphatase family protein [Candidatus Methanomethylophilaceae archaeon]|nr:inositol monophosphatase family protein [Candidatus Methanomethylophilaceae archaeon]MDD3351853.1 inositol monophosphatase family protein [Candidatus Methanomethylophilaceae archaeon]MDD3987152.1 inositol monophosphatase family protein [Candidatus Methanomethylophilaceae archaeon]MDD4708640.1 inositol monophosphatase family protein [Candidatus Methanomethylophilaceae archaeon]NCA73872.1 inositol monophosphatase [Gammaproteobacteria bacterium]
MCMMDGLTEAAREAGRIMLDRRGLRVSTKGTRENLATTADLNVERFLRKRLPELVPGSSFVGEEDGKSGEGDLVWIVDPIDGTANYARDLRVSTVSIALRRDGETVAGAVYQPYTDEMFCAMKGKGTSVNGRAVRVSDRPLANSMFCTSWSAYRKERAPMCFRISERVLPLCEDIRRFGTAAYELSLLAEGRIDIFFEAALQPWDIAAGALIVREAGGVCGSVYGPESYDSEGPMIAANSRESFGAIRDIVEEEMNKEGR